MTLRYKSPVMAETELPTMEGRMSEVKATLQRTGFLAPERPINDELDPETWTAMYHFAESRGLAWPLEDFEEETGEIPPDVMAALHEQMQSSFPMTEDEMMPVDDGDPGQANAIDLSSVEIFDLTTQHELNERKARRAPRALDKITTIVLHQTGIKFGVTRSSREKYGERVALHRRFYDVACHVAALMNGDVLYVNPWDRYVLHGNSSNRFSIGLEIEGLYAGVVGDDKTVSGGTPNVLTARTIAAARKAVQFSVEQGRKLGCPITNIAAHRNFHGSRISDPGQEIWREVALWAVEALDLRIDYELEYKSKKDPRMNGRKIPRPWDPSAKVDYRNKPLADVDATSQSRR
jgi:hypothetical protein